MSPDIKIETIPVFKDGAGLYIDAEDEGLRIRNGTTTDVVLTWSQLVGLRIVMEGRP
jgi:hypothetical protein